MKKENVANVANSFKIYIIKMSNWHYRCSKSQVIISGQHLLLCGAWTLCAFKICHLTVKIEIKIAKMLF